MSFTRAASAIAAVSCLIVASLAGCSSEEPAGDRDFCSAAKSAASTCKEPASCDQAIASACGSIGKAVSPATSAAAKNCLESGICGVASCLSRAQKGTAPTAEHKQLAKSFCQLCAPNLPDCEAGFYKKGSKSVGLAVLPYAAEIAKAIDDECTGSEGCQAGFRACSSEVIARMLGDALDAEAADCVAQGFGKDEGEGASVGPDGKPQRATCNADNCPGCCRDDRCEKGDVASACGGGGRACEICSPTASCSGNSCKEPCGPNTCGGCCDGELCVLGTAKDKCGNEGIACKSCAGSLICSNHLCIDGSCQATCTNGCCTAAGCQTGTAASACGTGGEACVNCGVGRTCSAGRCQLDRASLWDVYISFAIIPTLAKNGAAWDPLGGAPDPYLIVYTSEGTSAHSGQTSVITDSTSPFWAETPLKGIKASELLANTSIEIWDSDLDFDDFIGGCKLPLTAAIFDGSLQSHTCPATASGVEVKVYYRINPNAP
ncbi:MAG: hypothetical protein KF819_01585 [Labilithrix sp.]|nr:hypothetical protein [Labilithrix sp.]